MITNNMRNKIEKLKKGDKFSVNSVKMIEGKSKEILDRVFEVKNIGKVSNRKHNCFLSKLLNISESDPFFGGVLKDSYDEEHYIYIPKNENIAYILIRENRYNEKPENEIGEIESIKMI